ncbi:MAG TPA: hypothetical protein VI685_06640 [Candidatus Angelobacter sp.]
MTRQQNRSVYLALLSFMCAIALAGCSVHVTKNSDGSDKDVDVRSPFGSVSVHKGEGNTKDLGLPVYPGAHPSGRHGDKDDNANVDVSSPWAGVKVVVRKFETDDAPDKVLDFYQKPMGKYGKVIQCNGGGSDFNSHHHHGNAPVSCDGSGSDYEKELKVGTENDQHVVAVKPRGKGAEFTLVYVRAHEDSDKDDKDTI